MTKEAFYAVRLGRKPGIYSDWAECSSQVTGFKGASFKKFSTFQEASDFIKTNTKTIPNPTTSTQITKSNKRKNSKQKHNQGLII